MGLHRVHENLIIFAFLSAGVLELVDNPDLGSGGASRGGSSPPTRTRDGLNGPSRVLYGGIGFPRTPCGLKPFPYLPPSSANTRAGRAADAAFASLKVLRFSVGAVPRPGFRVVTEVRN